MKQKKYSVEDFILDKCFLQWVLNPSKEINIYWEKYVRSHPGQIQLIKQARDIILKIPKIQYRLKEEEIHQIWEKIQQNKLEVALPEVKVVPISGYATLQKYTYQQNWYHDYIKFGRYVASFLFICIAIISLFLVKENHQPATAENEVMHKQTPWGQKMTIYLSDGSEVILNSGSKIEYLQFFSETERVVNLQGEAFFNIAKDSLKPFKVITRDMVTRAIGTSFNVRAYAEEGSSRVSLASGKVMVYHDSTLQAQLEPGQSATMNSNSRSLEIENFDLQQLLAWKDGILVFEDDDQEMVFDKLSKWYGVEFRFINNSPKYWNYNAEYKNLDLENVLGAIAFAMDFKYRISKDNVDVIFN